MPQTLPAPSRMPDGGAEIQPDLVSIVILAHDDWPDLELAIQSALHQSHQPVEVIIIDNDSSDATPREAPRRFGGQVRYVRQANLMAGGRTTGMRLANGEFVLFLDGNDFIAPNQIEKQMEVFRAEPETDIVYGNVRQFQSLAGVPRWADSNARDQEDMLAALLLPGNVADLMVGSVLLRRRALDLVGPWDAGLYNADWDYWLRAAWAGCRFRHCPGSLSFYRRRPGQMSADHSAIARGEEAVLAKALGYINREPYRSSAAAQLARLRRQLALFDSGMSAREALAKLAQARAADPEGLPLPAYLAAWALIVLPGGRRLAGARWLRSLRRGAARVLGYGGPRQ